MPGTNSTECPVGVLDKRYCAEFNCKLCVLWGIAWPWLVLCGIFLALIPFTSILAHFATRLLLKIVNRVFIGEKKKYKRLQAAIGSAYKRGVRHIQSIQQSFQRLLLYVTHLALHLPTSVENVVEYIFTVPLFFYLSLLCIALLNYCIEMVVEGKGYAMKQRFDATPSSHLRDEDIIERQIAMSKNALRESLNVLKLICVIFLGIIVLEFLHLPMVDILESTTLIGIAVAFAAQPWMRNMISAVLIFVDGNFSVGDRIVVDGCEGVVESISLRSTVLKRSDHSISYVPNTKMMEGAVLNESRAEQRLISVEVIVPSSTTAETLRAALDSLQKHIRALHPSLRSASETDDNSPAGISSGFYSHVYLSNLFAIQVDWYSSAVDGPTKL